MTLDDRFERLIDQLREATRQTDEGKTVDLKNIEKEIEALCSDAKKATPEEASALQTLMAKMISQLDELEASIKLHQKKLRKET
jgi:hypothetical protein